MDRLRRLELEFFRRMTPSERLRFGMELSSIALAARDARLRREHPDLSEEEFRWIRAREALGLPRDAPLP